MHDFTARIERRLERFVREILPPATYRDRAPVTVAAWEVPGEPVSFAHATGQPFGPVSPGDHWGKPWGTTWFRVEGRVPTTWATEDAARPELVVDLGFTGLGPGFQAEALAWRPDGTLIKAVEPRNAYVPVPADEPFVVWLEAAANPGVPTIDPVTGRENWTRPSPMGDPATAGTDPIYRLRTLDLGLLDLRVWELARDVDTLHGLLAGLPATSPRRQEVLYALDAMLDAVDPADVSGTAGAGRAALVGVLSQPAHASAQRVHAVGHAHIDSGWLWPTRETVRKCARTFANVLALMDEDPDLTFACSSAQHYAWIKDAYPELYARIKARVAEGRFIPVGGMWVEADTNLPGGEAMVRQFLLGTGFFLDEFGVEPREVWLPDTFGYSAAMPQLALASGKTSFLTQKMSWNDTNRFPHHTFWWTGIDGSRVFTHFPPGDTYGAVISGAELARSEGRFAERGRANTALLPFGFGDGGGGPTREMLAAARRAADLEGSPRALLSTPQAFFDAAKAEYAAPPTWSGEMYLEYHRGTYTSQQRSKAGNRRAEHLLREAELWATTASVRRGVPYPAEALDRIWKLVLLHQFHDILPGTSIGWVHREAERMYAAASDELEGLIAQAIATLVGEGDADLALNASPVPIDGVAPLAAGPAPATDAAASLVADADGWLLANGHLTVRVDAAGLLVSIRDAAGREVLAPGQRGGLLQVHRDLPNEWEAWDLNHFYRQHRDDLVAVDSVEPDGAALLITRSFGASRVVQRVWLDPASPTVRFSFDVDWHERRKLLKLSFPLDVAAERAASEIQFGHVHRATHANTSWDAARFETVAHRWVHVGEPGFGVALANSSTYGHDIAQGPREGGGVVTTVRASLLRAPMFPDPDADQGRHRLDFDLVIGAGIGDAVAAGYRLNLPLRRVRGAGPVAPLVVVAHPAVLVEAVKLAQDGSGDVIVRLYESRGGRASTRLGIGFEHGAVWPVDLLERRVGPDAPDEDGVALALRPFEIRSLRIRR